MSEKDILGGLVGEEKEVLVGEYDTQVLYVFGIVMSQALRIYHWRLQHAGHVREGPPGGGGGGGEGGRRR